MGVFGQSGLKSPTQRMESTTIKGVGVHKRAFAKLTYVGGGIGKCSGTIKSIESDVKKKHSELLSSEGGRVTAAPSLESISISNDGGQNIEDAMLFQADVKLKCYNSSDFDEIEKTFMTPGHRCNIGIGYAGTGLETIQGDVVGFNFSINYDLSYDITIKLGGVMDSVLSADFLTLSADTKKINNYKDPESGDETVPKDIIGNLVGEASQVKTKAKDGKAKVVGNIGLVNHQMDMSWWQNNDNNISYVTLQYLIDKINENSSSKGAKVKFDTSKLTVPNGSPPSEIQSANPLEMVCGWSAEYGPNADYSALTNSGIAGSLWLAIPMISNVWNQLTDPGGGGVKPKPATTAFLNKIFQKISDLTGGYLKMFLYNDPSLSKSQGDKFFVANRGTAIQRGDVTSISVKAGYKNGIRNVNVSSNLDSELIGMALNAAQSGQGSKQLDKVYKNCYPDAVNNNEVAKDLKDAMATLGDKIDEQEITTVKNALSAYVKSKSDTFQPNIMYGLDVSFTCDGYFGAQFGSNFTLDRLPSRLKKAYFVVTKIGHEFSGGDWTTDITGTMMLDA